MRISTIYVLHVEALEYYFTGSQAVVIIIDLCVRIGDGVCKLPLLTTLDLLSCTFLPLSLPVASTSSFVDSHPQDKFAVGLIRIQHSTRPMDICKILDVRRVDMRWFGNPIPLLDVLCSIVQQHVLKWKFRCRQSFFAEETGVDASGQSCQG